MDIASLKIAHDVARLGSFAATARALDVDPSSVSRTVAQIEAELGLRLFQRTTRRLSLTEEGAMYLARTAPLLAEFDAALEEARGARADPSGPVRLTTSVAFGQECLLPHLAEFHRLFPQVDLDLILTDTSLDLIDDQIDLAIRLAPAPTGDLICTRLRRTRYRVCVAPSLLERYGSRPDTPLGLSHMPCLRYALSGARNTWRFRDPDGHSQDVPVNGPFCSRNPIALRHLARDGVGVAVLADWLVDSDIAQGVLVDLFPDLTVALTGFDAGAWIRFPSRRHLPARVRATIGFLSSRLG